jgi:hypothetical protein
VKKKLSGVPAAKVRAYFKAAGMVLEDSLLLAAGFESPGDFHASVLRALAFSKPFRRAVDDLHLSYRVLGLPGGWGAKVLEEIPRRPPQGGRVQAARWDPSRRQRDRSRGFRRKGGKRTGQASGSS